MRPCVTSRAFMSAPRSSSAFTPSGLPACAARWSGCTPVVVTGFGLLPASSSRATTAPWPLELARCSGVYAPMRVSDSTVAPAYRSTLSVLRSPLSALQCSAVMPSPCAALTSAPSRSKVRTPSISPRMAASATGETETARRRGAACPAITITASAPANTVTIERLRIVVSPRIARASLIRSPPVSSGSLDLPRGLRAFWPLRLCALLFSL